MGTHPKARDARDAPWFALWVGDWLSGRGPSLMTPEQEGGYLRLLLHSWLADPPCTLPDDDAVLARLSRLNRRWTKVGGVIRQQFEVVEGRLRNAKLYSVHSEMVQRHEQKSAAGRKGADARWGSTDEPTTADG